MDLINWTTHTDALQAAEESGALAEVHEALERAYYATADESEWLRASARVVRELRQAGWNSCRVWAPQGPADKANDQFDAWKALKNNSQRFGVGVEVEWVWNRVYLDFLKFWRGQTGGQIKLGIEVMRSPSAFEYAVEHSYALYQALIPDVRIVFCALEATEVVDPDYERKAGKALKYQAFPMP
jgi:hypothetical protein